MNGTGRESSIFYFESEDRSNLSKTLELVSRRVKETGIGKLLVFTRDGEVVFRAAKKLKRVKVIGVTFPYKQRFTEISGNGTENESVPSTSTREVAERFAQEGIPLVRGTMPFQQIVIPYARDSKLEGITHALGLFGGGLSLCIQAILMATDAGEVEPGEEVASMSADTAITATGTLSKWLFHPVEGMEIREIICKPRALTISRRNKPTLKEHPNV